MALEWVPVVGSREVSRVAYEADEKTIHVFFLGRRKDGGKWYRYRGCDEELWRGFLATPSKGRFVLDVLNGHPYDTLDADGRLLSDSPKGRLDG